MLFEVIQTPPNTSCHDSPLPGPPPALLTLISVQPNEAITLQMKQPDSIC